MTRWNHFQHHAPCVYHPQILQHPRYPETPASTPDRAKDVMSSARLYTTAPGNHLRWPGRQRISSSARANPACAERGERELDRANSYLSPTSLSLPGGENGAKESSPRRRKRARPIPYPGKGREAGQAISTDNLILTSNPQYFHPGHRRERERRQRHRPFFQGIAGHG